MPRAAIEAGAEQVRPLSAIAETLIRIPVEGSAT
jgi:chemotaxis response regulator CheB